MFSDNDQKQVVPNPVSQAIVIKNLVQVVQNIGNVVIPNLNQGNNNLILKQNNVPPLKVEKYVNQPLEEIIPLNLAQKSQIVKIHGLNGPINQQLKLLGTQDVLMNYSIVKIHDQNYYCIDFDGVNKIFLDKSRFEYFINFTKNKTIINDLKNIDLGIQIDKKLEKDIPKIKGTLLIKYKCLYFRLEGVDQKGNPSIFEILLTEEYFSHSTKDANKFILEQDTKKELKVPNKALAYDKDDLHLKNTNFNDIVNINPNKSSKYVLSILVEQVLPRILKEGLTPLSYDNKDQVSAKDEISQKITENLNKDSENFHTPKKNKKNEESNNNSNTSTEFKTNNKHTNSKSSVSSNSKNFNDQCCYAYITTGITTGFSNKDLILNALQKSIKYCIFLIAKLYSSNQKNDSGTLSFFNFFKYKVNYDCLIKIGKVILGSYINIKQKI